MFKNILFLLLLSFTVSSASAQVPVAAFSANVTAGCASLPVAFTDQSTGAPKFWNWDFGNGQLSNLQNPVVVYTLPGTYTVRLVVRNNNGVNSITKTAYITVNPSPTVDFFASLTTACSPATIQFSDLTVPNAGTITSWQWDFGDGTTSTQKNPSKTYTQTGFYAVSLKVTSSTGCTNAAVKARYIRIISGVKAQFTNLSTGSCKVPYTVNFTNQSSGPGTLTYNWDLGNASTSTLANPTSVYNASGNYVVKLYSTSSLGCVDSIQKTINLTTANIQSGFPDSACVSKPISFQNTSTPNPVTTQWNFGDGKTSNQANALNAYTTPGIYQVKMVTNFGYCKDSIQKPIKILAPPPVDFTSDKRYACKGPFTVNFSDISPNTVGWKWDFGDGGTSTLKNPAHTYLNIGEYDVKLTITNNNGCENTVIKTKFIIIEKPKAIIGGVPVEGCVPFSFSPVSASIALDGIASYFWDFGNGATSTLPAPNYIYNTPGTYNVKLRITTVSGCTDSATFINAVKVGTLPVPDFTANTFLTCASSPVQFTDLSVPADKWLWEFGDGETATQQNPSHEFTDTGKIAVKLTVWNNGCPSSITKPQYIEILPPIARFKLQIDCNNRLVANFVNQSLANPVYGPISYLWEFGDPGNNTSTAANPTFTYPALGNYNVKLTVTNGACTHVLVKPIALVVEKAAIYTDKTVLCKNEVFVTAAVNSNPANVSKYEWRINGGPVFETQRNFDTSFANTGFYDFTLYITDLNGCIDSLTINNYIKVDGPTARFGAGNNGGCSNSNILFNDSSSTTNASIVKWEFDFGDGTTGTFNAAPFTHLYTDTGTYTVQLKVTDDKGCTDTTRLLNSFRITGPRANFSSEYKIFCQGGTLQFFDSSQVVNPSYFWSFGDGGTSTVQNPVHIYNGADGFYTVKLKIRDFAGCEDSITKVNYIELRKPKPDFEATDTVSICPPLETKFLFKGKDFESFYWDFGDGSGSTLKDPNYFYNGYGSYQAKLFLVGYGGCLDSVSKNINIYNPYATPISYTPNSACNELLVNFTVNNPPFTRFIFYFGDGAVDSSSQKNFSHFYQSPNLYSPYLVLVDSLDCRVAVGGPTQINILGAEPFFGMDNKRFCDSGTVFFTNYAIGNDTVVNQVWNFGDGNASTTLDAVHTYTQPGTYYPSLTVTTKSGCVKTLDDTIRIYNTPAPLINGPASVCLLNLVNFSGSLAEPDTAAIKWSWNFGNGLTDTIQNPGPIRYAVPGDYTVTLKAEHPFGCIDSAATQVIKVHSLPVITMPGEETTILGSSIMIPVTYSNGIDTYTWSPASGLSCTNCPNPVASPDFTTMYKVQVTDSNGCKSNKDIIINVECNDKNYFVPNTFSPNGDGSNDVFFPRGNRLFDVKSMRIFNRWGQQLFEKKNFPANQAAYGWDGKVSGKLADADTYIFIIEVICNNAQIIPIKGNITLIR